MADVREQMDALIQQMIEKGVRYDSAVQDFEKSYISRVLQRVKGNQSRASRMLGMHRNTLSRKIGEYNLSMPTLRNGAPEPAASRNGQSRPSGRAGAAVASMGGNAGLSGGLKGGYGRR